MERKYNQRQIKEKQLTAYNYTLPARLHLRSNGFLFKHCDYDNPIHDYLIRVFKLKSDPDIEANPSLLLLNSSKTSVHVLSGEVEEFHMSPVYDDVVSSNSHRVFSKTPVNTIEIH